jgi:N-acetylglucosaminyldiphosphoundecaprenol N-acetyl-beta-D-mannosaminyltransferase
MAAKFLYGVALKRIPGVEFMHDICNLAAKKKKSIFLYGSREVVNRAAAAALRLKYPQLRIAGRSHGYVTESEMPNLVQRINHSGAEVLFLALGSPRQEKWFASHALELSNVKVCQGIGGTLDTIAGNVRRAPALWQKWSIEWLYRLLCEPKRLRRQKVLPVFVFQVIMTKLQSVAGM